MTAACACDLLDQKTTCWSRFSPCEFGLPGSTASSLSCWAMLLAQKMLWLTFSPGFCIIPGSCHLVSLGFNLWNLYYTSLELLSCRWHCCLIPGAGCLWLRFFIWMGMCRGNTVEYMNSECHLESIDFNTTLLMHFAPVRNMGSLLKKVQSWGKEHLR